MPDQETRKRRVDNRIREPRPSKRQQTTLQRFPQPKPCNCTLFGVQFGLHFVDNQRDMDIHERWAAVKEAHQAERREKYIAALEVGTMIPPDFQVEDDALEELAGEHPKDLPMSEKREPLLFSEPIDAIDRILSGMHTQPESANNGTRLQYRFNRQPITYSGGNVAQRMDEKRSQEEVQVSYGQPESRGHVNNEMSQRSGLDSSIANDSGTRFYAGYITWY